MNIKKITKHTLLLLALFASNLFAQDAATILISPSQRQALGILVAPLASSTMQISHRLPGEIVVPVSQERVVSAAQGGLVDALNVAAGAEVKKGQVLGHITSPELVSLQRDYLQSLTQYRLAKNIYDRDAELYKDGIIAERRYLTTQSGFEEAKAILAQRRQSLKLSGMADSGIARLNQSSEFASGLSIVAPIDGQVLEQLVTVGQRIDPATPMFRIGRLNPLWLEIHAPVESLASVAKGMQVNIPQYQAEGRIIAIIRNINKNDQTMHVRAEITKNADKLSPGQFVEAEVVAENMQGKQFSVPKAALIRQGVDSYLFVESAQGFVPAKVTVISEQADKAVVAGEFSGKEKVAITGTVAIKAAWIGTGSQ